MPKVDDAYFQKNQANDAEEYPQDGVYAFDMHRNLEKCGERRASRQMLVVSSLQREET